MPQLLYDDDETRTLLRSYFDSRDYWILPNVSEAGAEFARRIEERFYTGKKNADFHLVMGPMLPGLAICFAHKKWLSAKRLEEFIHENGSTPNHPISTEQDIVLSIFQNTTSFALAAAQMALLEQWLYPSRRN